MDGSLSFLITAIVSFIIGVFITRWIFGIDKIVDNLIAQNEYALIQVRLLKKMLINAGVPVEDVDDIITKGNQKK